MTLYLDGPVKVAEATFSSGYRLAVSLENVKGVRPVELDAREVRDLRDVLTEWLISIGAVE